MGRNSLNRESLKNKITKYLIFIIYLYFLYRLFYFATHISINIPPDEITHFGISKIFSKIFFLPKDSIESYEFGLITHVPYLYYYLMGKWLNLNFFNISELIFLRMGNVIITFAMALYGLRWIKLITSNRITILLFMILLTNTPMLSFLGASVNYDNLTNLFAVTTLFYFHRYFINNKTSDLLLGYISFLGGTLTKSSFLPLAFIYFLIFIFHERKRFKGIWLDLQGIFSGNKIKEKILFAIFTIVLICNLTLYMGNLIKFKKIYPDRTQILTEKQAMKNRVYARDRIVDAYMKGKLTLKAAIEMANEVKHTGDRESILKLLQITQSNKIKKEKTLNRLQYTGVWMKIMLKRIIGIAGHIGMSKEGFLYYSYQIIFILTFINIIIFFNNNNNFYLKDAVVISGFYGIILMQFVNYPIYEHYSSLSIALQGRYFFPVIVPFYAIMSYYFTDNYKNNIAIPILIFISVIFIYGDFPFFIQNATQQWFFN
jgi:hypothetical protein